MKKKCIESNYGKNKKDLIIWLLYTHIFSKIP